MPFATIDITGGQVSGVDSLSSAPSSVINFDVDEAGVNVPRAPLSAYPVTNIGTSPVVGMERWGRHIIAVTQDRYVRYLHESGPSVASVISTSSTSTQVEGTSRPTFVVGADYVYIAGGGRIQRWNDTLANTEVISASPSCTHIASIGQYLIANDTSDPSILRWSDIGEGAWGTWPAANNTTAQARPDPIIGIYENINELFVFGNTSTQVYQVGADPTLPFDIVSTTNMGLAAPYAVTRINEQFAILDDARRIVITDGRSVTPLSSAIQSDLRRLGTIDDCWMYHEQRGQYSLLVVRFPTERRTFVYDMTAQRWGERNYYVSPFPADWPVNAYVYWPNYNYHLFGGNLTDGGLFQFATTHGTENSQPLVCERVNGWQDYGTQNRKRSVRVRATMRRGTAAQNATPGSLEVRAQFDDAPWTTWKQISVGGPDDYKQHKDVFIGGIFRRCRTHVRYSNTDQMSLVRLEHEINDLGVP